MLLVQVWYGSRQKIELEGYYRRCFVNATGWLKVLFLLWAAYSHTVNRLWQVELKSVERNAYYWVFRKHYSDLEAGNGDQHGCLDSNQVVFNSKENEEPFCVTENHGEFPLGVSLFLFSRIIFVSRFGEVPFCRDIHMNTLTHEISVVSRASESTVK